MFKKEYWTCFNFLKVKERIRDVHSQHFCISFVLGSWGGCSFYFHVFHVLVLAFYIKVKALGVLIHVFLHSKRTKEPLKTTSKELRKDK